MAISINPSTHVIYVPKADLTLIQVSPEVRELDVDWFRLELKDLEDDPDYGIFLLKTHDHNTEVALAGLTYARIVEILDPYTVEFEDGQYTVNCVGANHNISDVKVANQVSLIVNNAAGLITNAQIEYSSFQNGVTIDVTSSYSGTLFPIGTPQQPVNNLSDALLIAQNRGFKKFYVLGDLDITTETVADYVFVGESMTKSEIDIDAGASCSECEFYECHILGTLDGDNLISNCKITSLNYVNGVVEQCLLGPGTITLGGGVTAHFLDCWSGTGDSTFPVLNMGGSGQSLIMQNYNGDIQIANKSGSDTASINLNSGRVKVAATVTDGAVLLHGVGVLEEDLSGGTAVVTNNLLSNATIASSTWDEVLSGTTHNIPSSAGRRLRTVSGTAITDGTCPSTGTVNTVNLNGDAFTTDGAYDPAMIAIVGGTGEGQCRNILQYDGTNRRAIVDRNWKTIPDDTSQYVIYADSGREHVNEGLAQGGTSNTITLNTLASSDNNAYNGQRVFIRSGTGEDQARRVTAYNGTTKIATVEPAFAVIPDDTSAYVMLPTGVLSEECISGAVWGSTEGLTALSYLAFIKGIEGGRWKMDGTQMIFYDDDNVTEIARFDITYDGNNYPTERVRV
jgi:hypothetical protein